MPENSTLETSRRSPASQQSQAIAPPSNTQAIGGQVTLSIDGQEDVSLPSGGAVTVRMSEHRARFVSFRDPSTFYSDLAQKLEFQLSSTMNNGQRA